MKYIIKMGKINNHLTASTVIKFPIMGERKFAIAYFIAPHWKPAVKKLAKEKAIECVKNTIGLFDKFGERALDKSGDVSQEFVRHNAPTWQEIEKLNIKVIYEKTKPKSKKPSAVKTAPLAKEKRAVSKSTKGSKHQKK